MEHSPIPWKADGDLVEDAGGWAVADCDFIGYSDQQKGANAALIAQAVNCHADLLAALKVAAAQFRFYEEQHLAKSPIDTAKARTNMDFAAICEDAIAKAEAT